MADSNYIPSKKPAAPSVSRRSAVNLLVGGAAGVAAAGTIIANASTTTPNPAFAATIDADPIFPLIDAHKRLWDEFGATLDSIAEMSSGDERDELEIGASAKESNAIAAVFRAEATTLAGAVAQIRYASKYLKSEWGEVEEEDKDDIDVPSLLDALANSIEKIQEG